jgi:hypothetical protein
VASSEHGYPFTHFPLQFPYCADTFNPKKWYHYTPFFLGAYGKQNGHKSAMMTLQLAVKVKIFSKLFKEFENKSSLKCSDSPMYMQLALQADKQFLGVIFYTSYIVKTLGVRNTIPPDSLTLYMPQAD